MRQCTGLVYEFYYDWLEAACQDLERLLEPTIHLNQTCFDDDLYDSIKLQDLDEEGSLFEITEFIMDFIRSYEPWYDEGYTIHHNGHWHWWYSFPYYYAAVA
jgi:hypothetical protein